MIGELSDYIASHAVVELALWSMLALLAGNLLRRRLPFVSGPLRLVGHLGLLVGIVLAGAHLMHVPFDVGPFVDAPLPQQTMTGGETRVRLAEDGHFWVQVRAQGIEKRLLVDTGATLTTLSAATAAAMGAIPDPDGSAIMLTTANGTTQAELGIIPTLRVGNVVVHHLPVAVAPGMAETNVLGMNFLSQLASWRVEGHTLILVPHHPSEPTGTPGPT